MANGNYFERLHLHLLIILLLLYYYDVGLFMCSPVWYRTRDLCKHYGEILGSQTLLAQSFLLYEFAGF